VRILNEARSSGEPHVVFWVIVELLLPFLFGIIPMAVGAVLGGVIANAIGRRQEARAGASIASSDSESPPRTE
jgi:hypothetical protein